MSRVSQVGGHRRRYRHRWRQRVKSADEWHVCVRAVLLGKRDVIVLIARAVEGSPLDESRAFAILDGSLVRRVVSLRGSPFFLGAARSGS